MGITNELIVEFPAIAENESLARVIVSVFAAGLNPTIEELSDLKVAVSEAVTNAIIHGYDAKRFQEQKIEQEKPDSSEIGDQGIGTELPNKVRLAMSMQGRAVTVSVTDYGCGIEDIDRAMEPLYTTKPEEERSGMGFSFMEAFTNELKVSSAPGKGTTVIMKKVIGE